VVSIVSVLLRVVENPIQGGQGRVGPPPTVMPFKALKMPASGSVKTVMLTTPKEKLQFVVGPASSSITIPAKISPLKLTPPPGLPTDMNRLPCTTMSVSEFTVTVAPRRSLPRAGRW